MFNAGTTACPPAALNRITFSSEDLAPSEALDAWLGWFGGLNDYIPAEGIPFAARVDYWQLERFVFGSNVASPLRLVRDRVRARRDGLDHWVLRVSRRGIVRSRSGDRNYVSRPGELVLERLSGCYEDDWSADEWVALIFTPGDFPEIDRTLEGVGTGPVAGARSGLVADYLLALERRLPHATQADAPALARATRAVVSTLSPEPQHATARPTIAARLRAEQVICANLGSARLDSQRIATLSGISRSKLYRLFEDEGGVAAHVRRLRLDTVHAALTDPDQNGRAIHAIAGEAGFHCVASFNRAFKARFGASPGEVRAAQHLAEQIPARGRLVRVNFLDGLFDRQTRFTTDIVTAATGR
jgi:AraC-like DNA-binding protein